MKYVLKKTPLDGLVIFEFENSKNFSEFSDESFSQRSFNEAINSNQYKFVQDNQSKSIKNVLRGMHYQIQNPQGKLVRVLSGSVFDVAVDLRKKSKTFCQWFGFELNSKSSTQIWIPPGFAHGFLVLSETAEILYKTTDYWYPEHERTLLWSDTDIDIKWPTFSAPILAQKDSEGTSFINAEVYD